MQHLTLLMKLAKLEMQTKWQEAWAAFPELIRDYAALEEWIKISFAAHPNNWRRPIL